jgi:hypothetical protein
MLDFNHRAKIGEQVTALIDAGLEAERAVAPSRRYLGGSRLGHPCERALQFEFAGAPKDEGADFNGRTLRIFAIGHALEDLAIRWLRGAGFALRQQPRRDDGGHQRQPAPGFHWRKNGAVEPSRERRVPHRP